MYGDFNLSRNQRSPFRVNIIVTNPFSCPSLSLSLSLCSRRRPLSSRHRWEGQRRRGLDSFHGDAPPEPRGPTTPNKPLGHRRFNCCRTAQQSRDRAIVVVSANRAPDKSIVEPRDGLGLAIVSFCRTSGALRRDWRTRSLQ